MTVPTTGDINRDVAWSRIIGQLTQHQRKRWHRIERTVWRTFYHDNIGRIGKRWYVVKYALFAHWCDAGLPTGPKGRGLIQAFCTEMLLKGE